MSVEKTHIFSDETGQEMLAELRRIAAAQETGATQPTYDASAGKYTNASLDAWLHANLDQRIFTVRIPKYSYSHDTTVDALDDLVGLTCTPSTNLVAGRDDFKSIQAFEHFTVNGGAADTGAPWVSAIEGREGGFNRYGGNGDVFEMERVKFERHWEDTNYKYWSVSAYPHPGFTVQPGGLLPDGTMRPYMLYAKYPFGTGADGKAASISGVAPITRSVSHNASITLAAAKGDGYSGLSIADYWHMVFLHLFKHPSKSSQTTFSGCSSYNQQYQPALAEEGVKRVVLTTAQAANLLVGSSMMLGTHAGDNPGSDRNTAVNHDVFDNLRITRIEAIDATNSAVYFDDAPSTFDTETTYLLSTAPWFTGSCDNVLGSDGSPTDPHGGKEPYVIGGIEMMLGMYEVMGDVMVNLDANGAHVMVVHDSHNASSSAPTSDYVDTGITLDQSSSNADHWALDVAFAEGMPIPQGSGGSATTGLGDTVYTNAEGTTGTREYLLFGILNYGSSDGLFRVVSHFSLSYANWGFGGRLSVTGRSRG